MKYRNSQALLSARCRLIITALFHQ